MAEFREAQTKQLTDDAVPTIVPYLLEKSLSNPEMTGQSEGFLVRWSLIYILGIISISLMIGIFSIRFTAGELAEEIEAIEQRRVILRFENKRLSAELRLAERDKALLAAGVKRQHNENIGAKTKIAAVDARIKKMKSAQKAKQQDIERLHQTIAALRKNLATKIDLARAVIRKGFDLKRELKETQAQLAVAKAATAKAAASPKTIIAPRQRQILGRLNVKSSPSLKASIVAQLRAGQTIKVIRNANDRQLQEIRLPDGRVGFVKTTALLSTSK